MLEKMVKELALIEKEVIVPEQYHNEFIQRRAELINKISGDSGGVQISFPRAPKVKFFSTIFIRVLIYSRRSNLHLGS